MPPCSLRSRTLRAGARNPHHARPVGAARGSGLLRAGRLRRSLTSVARGSACKGMDGTRDGRLLSEQEMLAFRLAQTKTGGAVAPPTYHLDGHRLPSLYRGKIVARSAIQHHHLVQISRRGCGGGRAFPAGIKACRAKARLRILSAAARTARPLTKS